MKHASLHRPSPWLMTPALVAGTWLLSAQAPATDAQLAALEKRVADLEALISKTGNVTSIKGPFMVTGQDGKPILEVANTTTPRGAGAVLVARHPGTGGGVYVMDEAGKAQAGMGIAPEGHGAVYAFNKAGKIAAQLNGTGGVAVWNDAGDNVAVMNSTKEGKGRLSIWDGQTRIVLLEDSAGTGSLALMKKSDGQPVARLGIGTGGAGRLSVMNPDGKIGAAVMGHMQGGGLVAVASKSGATLAQLGVDSEGRGQFLAFLPSGLPIAVLGQGGPGVNSGILQVSNAGGVKATMTVSSLGSGFLQLVGDNGTPTVEAGTLPNGRGTVRAGPNFKCTPLTAQTPIIGIPGWTECLVGSKEEK